MNDWVYPFPFSGYIFDYKIIGLLIIIAIVLLIIGIKKRGKKISSKRVFPITLSRIILLLIIVYSVYMIIQNLGKETYEKYIKFLGEFTIKYKYYLFGFLLAINLIRVVDLIKNKETDSTTNSIFEFLVSRNISYLKFFNQFFDGLMSRAPYIYDSNDLKLYKLRSIMNLFFGIIKFVLWGLFVLILIPAIINQEIYDVYVEAATTYGLELACLFGLINCDIFIYSFIKCIGKALSIERFKVTTVYSDGSVKESEEVNSNIIAIIILCFFVYLVNSAYYGLLFTSTLSRTFESHKVAKYIKKNGGTVIDYYE